MTAVAEQPAALTSPGRLAAPGTDPRRGTVQGPKTATPRPRTGRKILRTALSAAVVAVIFWFALPRFASYRGVLAGISAMTWPQALLIAAAAAASLASGWIVICSVLPSIRLREAAVVNLGSSAVANTLPAGGALAMGVSWAMLSGWGISTADYVLYSLVSGIWNVFARLSLPVLALLLLLTAGRPDAALIAAAAAGLALLTTSAAGLALLLRSEAFALRAGRALQCALATGCRHPPAASRRHPRIAARLPQPGCRPAHHPWLEDHRGYGGGQPCLVACPACMPARHRPVPGPGALADLPRRLRGGPAGDSPAGHPRRSRDHRARPGDLPGRRRWPQGQRAGDRRRAALPGRHLPSLYPARRPRLPRVAARTRADPHQPARRRPGQRALLPRFTGARWPRRGPVSPCGCRSRRGGNFRCRWRCPASRPATRCRTSRARPSSGRAD